MDIRILDSEDSEIYRELRLKSLKENPEAFLTTYDMEKDKTIEQLKLNLNATENRFILGAFSDSQLMGIVTFVRESNPKITHKGNIYAMYISPEFREKGIGKSLVRELVIKAKQCDGLEQINLTVISNNIAAKRLYETIGFITYGKERNALKTGYQYWDEDLMVLQLN